MQITGYWSLDVRLLLPGDKRKGLAERGDGELQKEAESLMLELNFNWNVSGIRKVKKLCILLLVSLSYTKPACRTFRCNSLSPENINREHTDKAIRNLLQVRFIVNKNGFGQTERAAVNLNKKGQWRTLDKDWIIWRSFLRLLWVTERTLALYVTRAAAYRLKGQRVQDSKNEMYLPLIPTRSM